MSASVQSIITTGISGTIVDVECSLSNNLPNIVIVGFANKAVGEARERIRGAFATSHIRLPRKRTTVNLAPADLPKGDSGFDMAIAVAILLASHQIPDGITSRHAFIGELGLEGEIRPVRGIIGKLLAGREHGIHTFFIPAGNLSQARLVPRVTLIAVKTLIELYEHLTGAMPLPPLPTGDGCHDTPRRNRQAAGVQPSEVVGQSQAKRALEIAAAGGHNVFMSGPPGTGKSMLAKALQSILPPLTQEEMLEVTHMHSLAGLGHGRVVGERPFRAPHHSASHAAVIGGHALRPGEISLAHRGVLFLDELPEFSRLTLEALRQPLEDRVIALARAKEMTQYPANFILVATANPCPCGYYGLPETQGIVCRCLPYQIAHYRRKISGPILDRIDLYADVNEVRHDKLLTGAADPKTDNAMRRRIMEARKIQRQRFQSGKLNNDMTNRDIKKYCRLTPEAKTILSSAAEAFNISARSYMRTVKVARTVADLGGSTLIAGAHISEALMYRGQSYREQ